MTSRARGRAEFNVGDRQQVWAEGSGGGGVTGTTAHHTAPPVRPRFWSRTATSRTAGIVKHPRAPLSHQLPHHSPHIPHRLSPAATATLLLASSAALFLPNGPLPLKRYLLQQAFQLAR